MRPSLDRRRGLLLAAPVLALSVAATLPGAAVAHEFDHPPQGFATGFPDPTGSLVSGGRDDAEFEVLTTIPTGNPHSDLDFFTRDGEVYAAVGTLGMGLNDGGQTIVKLTEGGQAETEDGPAAQFVGAHPSAACLTDETAALGLQHDVEATPKAAGLLTSDSYLPADPAKTGDAQLLIDATDASGRCHDQGLFGVAGVTNGGLEIVDITTLGDEGLVYEEGRTGEIALTSHIGEAHTVNVDPQRPHIAYAVTSDSVSVTKNEDGTYTRANEVDGSTSQALDGFEVVDLSSCLTAPYGTMADGLSIDEKREACKPEVYRYRYPTAEMALGHTLEGTVYGCHELQMYADDLLTCGSGAAAMLFDVSGAFEDPDGDGIDTPKGTPLPCHVRETSTSGPTPTGALVTDCVNGGEDGTQSLVVSEWLEIGAPSLEGVAHLGTLHHAGRASATGFQSTRPATEDIDFNHEMEFTHSRRFVLSTDERGGGVTGGAQCSQEDSTPGFANGGINAQKVSTLVGDPARTVEATDASYALDGAGAKSIYRAPVRSGVEGAFCTAHVMQQVPGQNRIVMGWYSQGTQVVDYVELPGEKLQFVETAYGIPPEANHWTSHVFSVEQAEDGRFVYYGAAANTLGVRHAIDVFKLTLPAPLTPCDIEKGTGELAGESTVEDRDQAAPVHVENVDCVLNWGISTGKTADAEGNAVTYGPADRVTRGQMASFIARTLVESRADDGALPAAGADRFSDIEGSTHREAINRLAEAGIVSGVGGGRFDPNGLISRAQMASFVVKAARFIDPDGDYAAERSDWFGDVPAGDVHAGNIAAGYEAGLFRGTTAPGDAPRSGAFSPTLQVPRDQMASFLVALFEQSVR